MKYLLVRNKDKFIIDSNVDYYLLNEYLINVVRMLWHDRSHKKLIYTIKFCNISIGTYDVCTLYKLEDEQTNYNN